MTPSSDSAAARRRAVAWALATMVASPRAPQNYTQLLLSYQERGELSAEAVAARLAASVYHILYRSQATYFPNEEQLQELLEQSRTYNVQHDITGLLLYSDGRFVQVIEGSEEAIETLFEHIQQDPRHQHVFALSEGPGPHRWFTDWSMAFGMVTPVEMTQAIQAVEAGKSPVVPLEDPHLQTLVEVFSLAQPGVGNLQRSSNIAL